MGGGKTWPTGLRHVQMLDRGSIRPWRRVYIVLALCLLVPSPGRAQIFELPRNGGVPGDFFGAAVAIENRRALVGATGEDACGVNSGAAYLYEPLGVSDEWDLAATLVASDCEASRFFGRSVALSDRIAVVAASQEFFSEETPNAVYVFEPDSAGNWRETARLTGGPPSEEGAFGTSVSVDDGRILVTTSGNPAGARVNGTAYVFERGEDGLWKRTARLTGETIRHGVFGTDGAIQGDHAVVAASTYFQYRPGSVYFFRRDTEHNRWEQTARFYDVDDFFISVDIDDAHAIVGESKAGPRASGTATLFERQENGWRKLQTLRLENPYDHGAFGTEVAIDGEHVIVAAYDEQLGLDFNIHRVVYVFKRGAEGRWEQRQLIDLGDVAFGTSLDVHAGYAVIGSAADARPGAAYVVKLVE